MSLIEETIERITQKEGVDGFFVVDDEGNMLRCKNLSEEFARSISDIAHALVSRARHVVRDIHATEDLRFFRMRAGDMELIAAPAPGFTVVALQRWTPAEEAAE